MMCKIGVYTCICKHEKEHKKRKKIYTKHNGYKRKAVSYGFFFRFKNGVFLLLLFVTSFFNSCRQVRIFLWSV